MISSAVEAEEVANLAEMSGAAAAEIESILSGSSAQANEVVERSDRSLSQIVRETESDDFENDIKGVA